MAAQTWSPDDARVTRIVESTLGGEAALTSKSELLWHFWRWEDLQDLHSEAPRSTGRCMQTDRGPFLGVGCVD